MAALAALVFLVSPAAALWPSAFRAEVQVHSRGGGEAERRGDPGKVELVHVEDGFERVRRVRHQVRPKRLAPRLVQVVVLLDEAQQLSLHVGDLGGVKLVLVEAHLRFPQVPQEPYLFREEEEQGAARPGRPAGCAADPVDVLAGVVGGVVLDDPVHFRDVEPPRGHVRAAQDALRLAAKLEKSGGALLLLLLPVDVHHGHVDVVEELGVVLDAVAARKEHHDLFVAVPLQKSEEQQEAFRRGAHDVALLQTPHRRLRFVVVHPHVHGLALDAEAGQVLHFLGLRRAEEHRLPLFGEELDDLVHLLLEPLLQDAVRFVDDEHLQVAVHEPFRVLQVV
mmetsp:Transcript_59862/g.120159  ORF Transcript_59862/g.120159 Transcript_59862/m.120159 type:complete len:337 (+) Transcript_59862:174-1184(+)